MVQKGILRGVIGVRGATGTLLIELTEVTWLDSKFDRQLRDECVGICDWLTWATREGFSMANTIE